MEDSSSAEGDVHVHTQQQPSKVVTMEPSCQTFTGGNGGGNSEASPWKTKLHKKNTTTITDALTDVRVD